MLKAFFSIGSKNTLPNKPGLSLDEAYTTCSELPYYNFIKLNVTKDYKWLIKSGNPGNLEQVWADIYAEYTTLVKDTTSQHIFELRRDIDHLDKKLIIIQSIVDFLTTSRNEELIQLLREYGYKFQFIDLEKDLKRVITVAKGDLLRLKQKEAEYTKIMNSGTEPTEFDYEEGLSELAKYQGYHIQSKNITVSEYLAIFNRFKAYVKAMTPKNGQ